MMKTQKRSKLILAGFGIVLLLLSAACGGGNSNQAAPPPPPAVPNPVPAPPPTVPGTNCPAIGGANPFSPNNTPYYAQLMPMNGMRGGMSDTLILTLGYLGQATPGQPNTPVVASGAFNFSDMQMLFGGGMPPSNSMPNTNICISSQSPNGGSPFPGTLMYGPQGQMLSLTLYGTVPVPVMNMNYTYSPWGNVPGTPSPTTQTAQFQLSLGNGMQGGAEIQGSRILGPVFLTIQGPQGPMGPIQYMAQ